MNADRTAAVALTVAGSDSGSGAGIQADLQTFRAFGVFGTSVITCITAQNPNRIRALQPVKPRIVAEQIESVFAAFPVSAAKTGMLYDAAIVETVAAAFRRHRFKKLVIDPVMLSSSGTRLLKRNAISVLATMLFPQAAVVTPNLAEAETILRRRLRTLGDLRDAARALSDRFGVPFLMKGGHLPAEAGLPGARRAVDVLFDGRRLHEFSPPFVAGIRTHGTGCVLSAAIAANLALGYELVDSVSRAKRFVTRAIRNAVTVGDYRVLKL